MSDREVRRDTEAERRLTHGGTGSRDDQVPGLEARGEAIEIAEPGGDTGNVGAGLVEGRDTFEALLEKLIDVGKLARDARLREIEDDLLGLVDEVDRIARPLPAEARDLAAGPDQPAQRRHLADDARIVAGVRARGNERRKLVDPDLAADVVQLAALLELVDERDRVDGVAFRVERDGCAVDLGMALAVEVGCVEDLADRPDRPGGDHHRAEDGFLGLEVLGRDRGGLRGLRHLGELGDLTHRAGVNRGRGRNGRGVNNRPLPTRWIPPRCRHNGTYVPKPVGQICG
jgi:hypothetical protein